jgi:hypothetical protein
MNATTNMTDVDRPEAANSSTREQSSHNLSRIVSAGIGLFALGVVATGVYCSLQPDPFDVREAAVSQLGGDEERLAPGAVTVATVGQVARTLLEKPGGYLYNDVSLPGIYLDNMLLGAPAHVLGAGDRVRTRATGQEREGVSAAGNPGP